MTRRRRVAVLIPVAVMAAWIAYRDAVRQAERAEYRAEDALEAAEDARIAADDAASEVRRSNRRRLIWGFD